MQAFSSDQMAGEFYMLDWTREVDTHEAYVAALNFIVKFHKSNSNFRRDVARSTAKVLGKHIAFSEDSESGNVTLEYCVYFAAATDAK